MKWMPPQISAPAASGEAVARDAHPILAAADLGRSSIRIAPGRGRALTTAGIFLLIMGIGYASVRVQKLTDAATVAAAKEALFGLAAGDLSRLDTAGVGALALVLSVALLKPLVVVGALLLIEWWVGPTERSRKNYLLVWVLQALLLIFATLLQRTATKIGIVPSEPLLAVGETLGPIGVALSTFSLYLLALLVADFIRYWFHRANHRFTILWRFHAIHHSARDLDVLHNITHPLEYVANFLLIAVPSAFLIPTGAGDLYLFAAFLTIQAQLIHMNVPVHFGIFGNLICDNRYHFVHHSMDARDHNRNFAGLFPVLDMMFGTYRKPAAGALPATGLVDQEAPTTLGQYLLARRGSPSEFGRGGREDYMRADPATA
jgi:sterol desaturase/sphingolipid hydroxylase (fatty acid hydroxylase superfamily)